MSISFVFVNCQLRKTSILEAMRIKHKCIGILFLFFLLSRLSLYAVQEELSNTSIIELQSLNLGDSVIIGKIKTSQCDFDLSIDGLKQLKAANVSASVIETMLATKTHDSSRKNDENDPLTIHAAGVWVLQETNGQKIMIKVPFYQARGGVSGNSMWVGWGAQVEQYVSLPGAHAALQLNEAKPVFYFYFLTGNKFSEQGGSIQFMNIQSPEDIIMLKFQIKKNGKNLERHLSITKSSAWNGSSQIESAMRNFDSEKIADGIYKVRPKNDLVDGEYCFSTALANGYGPLFAFGIKAASSGAEIRVSDPEVTELCEQLKSRNANEVERTLKKLRVMDAPEAVPQILPCLTNSSPNVIRDACRTLAVLGGTNVISFIEPLLKSSRADVRKDAQDAIDILKTKS